MSGFSTGLRLHRASQQGPSPRSSCSSSSRAAWRSLAHTVSKPNARSSTEIAAPATGSAVTNGWHRLPWVSNAADIDATASSNADWSVTTTMLCVGRGAPARHGGVSRIGCARC